MGRIKPIKVFRERSGRPGNGSGILNIGPKSAQWLRDAGITEIDEIRRLGVIGTCRKLRDAGHPLSLLMAYALEGALTGCHWNRIPADSKEWLRAELAALRQPARRRSKLRHA